MIPRYDAKGPMVQTESGNYVAATDCEKPRNELGNLVLEKYRAFQRGELTAEEALKSAAVLVRIKLSFPIG